MVTVQKHFSLSDFPLPDLLKKDKILLFDIETTGLTPANSSLYLIGTLRICGDEWILTQWMAETLSEEQQIITAFLDQLTSDTVLIHYNGGSFDLPYLKKCAAPYGIDCTDLDRCDNIDLMRKLQLYRFLVQTDDLKLQTIQDFFGWRRTDLSCGKELISVYQTYCRDHSEQLCQKLLLHNEEDLTGLAYLLLFFDYIDIIQNAVCGNLPVTAEDFDEQKCIETVFLHHKYLLRKPVTFGNEVCSVLLADNCLAISVSAVSGTLRHFFPDHKNYYYLPAQDMAIHKKVAEYLPKDRKEHATPQTAYQWRTGCFIPVPGHAKTQSFKTAQKEYSLFRKDRADPQAYLLLDELKEEYDLQIFAALYLKAFLPN